METDFSIVFTSFLLLMGEIKASKQKHAIVKCPVVLTVLLAKCSDGDAEGFCFQVLVCVPQTVTGISADILILLENRKKDASIWVPKMKSFRKEFMS